MTRSRDPIYAVLLFSVAALATVFTAQYGFNLHPCELCLLQRYPYGVAIVLALAALGLKLDAKGIRIVLGLCFLTFAVNGGIALYHVGVEQHWWAGPQACTAGSGTVTSVEDLAAMLAKPADVPQCDQPSWFLFGVTMAGYNLLACVGMAAFCALSMRRIKGTVR
jgi:disulfide bond formation protein DsbB